MSIKYRLQKNYGKLKEKAEFRAIVMERQTIGLERIGQCLLHERMFSQRLWLWEMK